MPRELSDDEMAALCQKIGDAHVNLFGAVLKAGVPPAIGLAGMAGALVVLAMMHGRTRKQVFESMNALFDDIERGAGEEDVESVAILTQTRARVH